MLVLLFCSIYVAAAQILNPPCENKTVALRENWTFINLPLENCFLGQDPVFYTYQFPADSVLCGRFHLWFQILDPETGSILIERPLDIIDSFGKEREEQSYTEIGYCFPPPSITFNFSRAAPYFAGTGDGVLRLKEWKRSSNEYKLKPLNYTKMEQYSITLGAEPLVMVMNSSLKNERVYKIKGTSKVSAYFVKQTDYFPWYEPTANAASIFVLNGSDANSRIIESVDSWNGIQEFLELNFIKMASANHNNMNAPALMIFMDSTELENLQNPQFLWPRGTFDYTSGSSVTLLDLDTYSKKCRYYTVDFYSPSDDLEIVVYSGFPKKNINEDAVIGRYNSSQLGTMILGCTNTIQILRGTVRIGTELLTVWSPGQHILFLSITNSTLMVKTEEKVSGYNTKLELSVYQNDNEIPASCTVEWRVIKSAPGSMIKMHTWLADGDGGREKFNPNIIQNGNFSLGKAAGVQWTNVNFAGPMTVEFQRTCSQKNEK